MENRYGKSAVDATRRNALPFYLDELLANGLGEDISVISVRLLADEWSIDAPYEQRVSVNISEDIGALIIFGDQQNQIAYAQSGVCGRYDDTTRELVFSATTRPTVDVIAVVLAVGLTVAEAPPMAENVRF